MTIGTGSRIGPYDVTALIGEGGMGKVWRAHHTALKRDDALKVLPDAFASDPDRLARFQREAQVLASLNHPNIAHVYGLEQVDGVQALVMELVEGPTLADRIAQGPIPVDEALPIAKQIAEALEAAHEQGIIHRDLKPANVKVRPDGAVKVLDFGLAKAVEPVSSAQIDATASPTITSPAMMTGVGMILGTAAYMAPEQAKGRPADKRSDVWAFGCVLYEMLTGRRAFAGDDISDTLAAVLRAEPDWNLLPAATPPTVTRLLRACLKKDRRQRIPDIAVVRFELDAQGAIDERAHSTAGRWRERLAWGCAAVLLIGMTTMAYVRRTPTTAVPSRIVFSVDPPVGNPFVTGNPVGPYPAIAPDGRQLAFVVRTSTGLTQLAVRSLDDPEVRILAGTEAATSPFWSPDARTIAFFSGGQLRRIDVSGGTPQVLCAAVDAAGGSWSRDGVILFTGPTGALFRIGASGGQPVPVTTLEVPQKESSHRAPWFLPDGRRFLYLAQPSNTIVLASLESPERKALVRATSKPVYSATGHLLFVGDTTTTLMAQRFDAARGELMGDAFRVADGVVSGFTGRAPFSASENGTLVYWTGALSGGGLVTQPGWFDRSGKPLDRAGEERRYNGIALSPDGRKVAFETFGERGPDIWVLDLARGISTRFTFEGADNPVWSPDSRQLAFRSRSRLHRKPVDGETQTLLWEGEERRWPESWSPDGRMVMYGSTATPVAGQAPMIGIVAGQVPIIGIVPVTADAKAMVWLATPFTKEEPHFSPDGRWVAYQSDESGQAEVYVQAFPGPGKKIRASSDGGGAPRWRAGGREIFYRTPAGMLMTVPVTATRELELGRPQPLFQTSIANLALGLDQYDVTADGQRFLVLVPADRPRQTPLTVVVNWQSVP